MNEACCGVDGHIGAGTKKCPNYNAEGVGQSICLTCGEIRSLHSTQYVTSTKTFVVKCPYYGGGGSTGTFKSQGVDVVPEKPVVNTEDLKEPVVHKFLHAGASTAFGGVVTVTEVPHAEMFDETAFRLKSKAHGTFYWQTTDKKPAKSQVSVGDTFKFVKVEGSFIFVEETMAKKVVPTKLGMVTIPLDKYRAAASDPTLKVLLEKLCPEAFEKLDIEMTFPKGEINLVSSVAGHILLEKRASDNPLFNGKVYLSSAFDWRIEKDGNDFVLLAKEK